jgi:hypothetical protein
MNENTKITLDAIISSKQNDVENAIKDFFTDNNPNLSVLLVSRKKALIGGDFVMNVVSLARAIRKSPIIRQCVEEALAAANGNYDYLQKRFKRGQDIEGIINKE